MQTKPSNKNVLLGAQNFVLSLLLDLKTSYIRL